MKKIRYNHDEFLERNFLRMKMEYPNDPDSLNMARAELAIDDEWRAICRANCLAKFIDISGVSMETMMAWANDLVDNLPNSLLKNIEEWVFDEEISEIRVGNLSIKEIMNYTHQPFYECAWLMGKYIKNGCKDEITFLHYFHHQ